MSNGYMYVAPRQEGKTFSQMVDEQKALIQAQQRQNVANQVASQRQKAQFQYQQLEKIYGFDVNGWSQDLIDAFKTRQDDISNRLKTGEYNDVASLIQDVGELSSIHGMGASDAALNKQGEDDYVGWETGSKEWTQDGTEFVGSAEDRQRRNSHTRGGGRLANQRVVNGRMVGQYVDVNGRSMEDVLLESDPNLRREEDEAGNVFLVGQDGSRTQVGGDAFNNPFVGNQANWAPSARPLGDVSVDAFSVELHKNAVTNLRGKENMSLAQKEQALANTLNQAFNGGSKTVDQRRVEQSAVAYWEQMAGGEIGWGGEIVEGVNDGLTPQELFVRDAVRYADLDEKKPQQQTRQPGTRSAADTLLMDVSRRVTVSPDVAPVGESLDPQDESLNPNSPDISIGQVPIPSGSNIRWSPRDGDPPIQLQNVFVTGNGQLVVTYFPEDPANDPYESIFGSTQESNVGDGSRVVRLDMENATNLIASINQKFRVSEDAPRNFFQEAYSRIMAINQ